MTPHTKKIIEQIKTGELTMRPRWHFVMKGIGLMCGLLFSLVLVVFVASLTVFVLQESGVWYVPGFGPSALQTVLLHTPWVLVLFLLLLMGVVAGSALRYQPVRQTPRLYLGVLLFGVVLGGMAALQASTVHDQFATRSNERGVPILGPVYRWYTAEQPRHVTIGVIGTTSRTWFELQTPQQERYTVWMTESTRLSDGQLLLPGTPVLVLGVRGSSSITAQGVRVAPTKAGRHGRPAERHRAPGLLH